MIKLIRTFILASVLGLSPGLSMAQSLPDSVLNKIDGLLSSWNRTTGPGMIAGVVTTDGMVYSQGYGLANLEHSVEIGPRSMFYMASVSKQFAGYAIAQLIERGLVDAEVDIHTYLPWLNDFGRKISVSNLLHHTSGLRDDIWLSQLAGLNSDGILTQDLALKLIARQHSLNFDPGEKYSYSNTNYVLLSEIVKRVSGMSFRTYVDSAIFKPLGMKSARFVDDSGEMIPERVDSYMMVDGSWKNFPHNVYTTGDGGMFCNAQDMAKWVANFWSDDEHTRRVLSILTTTKPLSNGQPNNYAMGISSELRNGRRRLIHNGALSGYRTIVVVYPEQKVAVFAFSNDRNSGIYGKLEEIADLMVGKSVEIPAAASQTIPATVTVDSLILRGLAGNYISESGFRVDLSLRNGRLYAGPNALAATSETEFYLSEHPTNRISINGDTLRLSGQQWPLIRIGKTPDSTSELEGYTGTYYSDELDLILNVRLENGQLMLHNARLGSLKMTPRGDDHIYTENALLKHLLVRRDPARQTIAFELNDGTTRGLRFQRISEN